MAATSGGTSLSKPVGPRVGPKDLGSLICRLHGSDRKTRFGFRGDGSPPYCLVAYPGNLATGGISMTQPQWLALDVTSASLSQVAPDQVRALACPAAVMK